MGFNGYDKPLTEPLSNFDVCKILGENTLDIGSLCTSESINKWSFHKPMKVDAPQELTLQQKYDVDGGFSNLSELLCKYSADYTEKWNNKDQGGLEWIYKPLALGDWFRLTDFIGYDPTAQKPQITLESIVPEDERQVQTIKVTITGGILPFLSGFSNGTLKIAVWNNIASGAFEGFQVMDYSSANGNSITKTFSPENDFGMQKSSWFFAIPCMAWGDNFLPLNDAYAYVWAQPVLYRTFKNIIGTASWEIGGYFPDTDRCIFTGDFAIKNSNKYSTIFVKVKVTGNREDQSMTDSTLVLHETDAPDSAIPGYKALAPGKVYSMMTEEGRSTWDWYNSEGMRVEFDCKVIYPQKDTLGNIVNKESSATYVMTAEQPLTQQITHAFDFTQPFREYEEPENV